MRLPDKEIVRRLATADLDKRIIITPLLFPEDQIGSAGIDLHLGTEFLVLDTSKAVSFNPLMSPSDFRGIVMSSRRTKRLSPKTPFILHPGELVLASTLEWLRVPEDLVAILDGRSRWARLGLKVHSTAGDIQPGSFGMVVFELQTDGGVPFFLYPGMRVAQLRFYTMLETPAESYATEKRRGVSFQGQLGPSIGAYPDDIELERLRAASLAE